MASDPVTDFTQGQLGASATVGGRGDAHVADEDCDGGGTQGVCAIIACGSGAPCIRRVAYEEGEGRSRSGPTSIHSGVSRMPPLTQERRCMLCREDLRVWDPTVVSCRV